MTTEELLKPRYKVIADYPGKPHTMPIGYVLTLDKFSSGKWWHQYTDVEPIHIDEGCTKFAAVLKQLDWWEERKLEDMPEYVKFIEDYMDYKKGQVFKFENWSDQFEKGCIPFRVNQSKYGLSAVPPHFNQLLPATKEEYDNQLNK